MLVLQWVNGANDAIDDCDMFEVDPTDACELPLPSLTIEPCDACIIDATDDCEATLAIEAIEPADGIGPAVGTNA